MTTTRPGYYPVHDANGTNLIAPEDSLYWFSGYPFGLIVPSADHNGKLQRSGDWHKYSDLNCLRNGDWLDAAAATFALASTALTYVVGGNVLTTGGVVATRGTYLLNGTRIETDSALLNPIAGAVRGEPLVYAGATAPGRIWIYVSDAGDVRFASAAVAAVDAPAANEMTLNGIDIDAAGAITDGAVAPITLPLPTYELGITIPIVMADLSLNGTGTVLDVVGGGVTAGAASTAINGGIGPGATVLSTSPTDAALEVTNIIGTTSFLVNGSSVCDDITADTIDILGGAAIPTLQVAAAVGEPSVSVTGSGAAVLAEAAVVIDGSTGYGLSVEVSGTASALIATSTGTTSYAAQFSNEATGIYSVSNDTGKGVLGYGGPNSVISYGVHGVATNANAHGVVGAAQASAGIFAYGVVGYGGSTSGSGVNGVAYGNGYGVVAQADTTSPVRASVRIVPQDDDPSSALQGDFMFNSSLVGSSTGRLRVRTSLWESVHASPKGLVWAFGSKTSGSIAAPAATGNLSLAQITPEQTGNVLVTATGTLLFSTDTSSCTITVVDATSAVTISTSVERGIDTDGVAPNSRSFCIRGIRALPNTSTRTFVIVITADSGTITYSNVICSVDGVS